MKLPLATRLIFSLIAVFTPVGAHLADYNETHIFNPAWPPHAKFHGGQTLMFSITLGLCTAFFTWRSWSDRATAVLVTATFASLYWITQAGAILYPGTDFWDSPARAVYLAGLPAQLVIDIVFLSLVAIASGLALRGAARAPIGIR